MTSISYIDDFITPATTGATDSSGVTDYTDAILFWLSDCRDAGCYREMIWTPGKTYGYKGGVGDTKHLYVPGHTRMVGWGATLKAMLDAGPTTAGLLYTDMETMGLGVGPKDFKLEGLKIDQRASLRRASGCITSSTPQENAAVYMISCQNFEVSDVDTIDTGSDGIYIGGDDRYGGYSKNGLIRRCHVDGAGRNAYSIVGVLQVHGEYNQATNIKFGCTVGNISDGFDFEPNDGHSQNTDSVWSYCLADNCGGNGFASRANNARVLWLVPFATRCMVGYYSIMPLSSPFTTKVVAARFGYNGTHFSGIKESLSGF